MALVVGFQHILFCWYLREPPNSHGLGFLKLGNFGRFLDINIFHGDLMGTIDYSRTSYELKNAVSTILQFASYVKGVQRKSKLLPKFESKGI